MEFAAAALGSIVGVLIDPILLALWIAIGLKVKSRFRLVLMCLVVSVAMTIFYSASFVALGDDWPQISKAVLIGLSRFVAGMMVAGSTFFIVAIRSQRAVKAEDRNKMN